MNVKTLVSLFSQDSWINLRSYILAVVIFLLGLLLSLATFLIYKHQDIQQTHIEFERIADIRLYLIEDVLLETLEQLDFIKQFYDSSHHISDKDFHKFVGLSFNLCPNLLALAWLDTSKKVEFDLKNLKIKDKGFEFANLSSLPPINSQFFPVTYLEKSIITETFAIDDTYYKPFINYLHNSKSSLSTTVSSKVDFFQSERKTGFFISRPVFIPDTLSDSKHARLGMLIGFSNFKGVIDNMRARIPPMGINISIFDLSSPIAELLYWDEAEILKDPVHLSLKEQKLQNEWARAHLFKFGNRTWKLQATPTLQFIAENQKITWKHWEVLLIGALISSLISSYFLMLVNQRMLIERQVRERTNELATTNLILQKEVHKRQRIEEEIIQTQKDLQQRHEALEYLTKFTISEPQHAIHEVILRTATVMQIDRVSIWFYEAIEQLQILSCIGVYHLTTHSFSDHLKLNSKDFPHYFSALSAHFHLIIPSRSNNELNQELSSYLATFHITSKLDIPIIFEGNLLGILSCEETRGHRDWPLEDRHFGQTIADITAIMITQSARRKAEKALKENEKGLIKAIREAKAANEAKNKFLATISHELRTPLNAIIGFNQCVLIGMDGPINEHQQTSLKKIEKSSFHLLNLINDILDLAKIDAHRMKMEILPYNIVEILESSVDEMQPLAQQKNINLYLLVNQPLIIIEIDKIRIRQVLLNLLSNAIKFTEKGSIEVNLINHPNHVEIKVKDTGIGLSQEEIEKIFQPFSQADSSITRKYGGTGLGLVISKNIVNLHGGTIKVKSEKGVGSTFSVTLPRNQPSF